MTHQTTIKRIFGALGILFVLALINWLVGLAHSPHAAMIRTLNLTMICKLAAVYGVIAGIISVVYYQKNWKFTEDQIWGIAHNTFMTFLGLSILMVGENIFSGSLLIGTFRFFSSITVWCVAVGIIFLILALLASGSSKSSDKPKDTPKKNDDADSKRELSDAELGAFIKMKIALDQTEKKAKDDRKELLKKLKDAGIDLGGDGGQKPAEKKPDDKEAPKEGKKD